MSSTAQISRWNLLAAWIVIGLLVGVGMISYANTHPDNTMLIPGTTVMELSAKGAGSDIRSWLPGRVGEVGAQLFINNVSEPGDASSIINLHRGMVGIGTDQPRFKLDVAGRVHATSFPTSSDVRFKTNITPLTNVLEKLENSHGVLFEWNGLYRSLGPSTGHREIGVIAQEVEAVFPELVTTWEDANYKAVDYGRLAGVLLEAIKEVKADKDARILALEACLAALEQTVGVNGSSAQWRAYRVGAGWPLIGGLPLAA